MNKEETTLPQGIAMITMFIFGSTLIVGGINEAQKDSWLAIVVGAVMAVPLFFIYARLNKILPKMDFYDVLQWTLGKVFGKIGVALFVWYVLHLGALVFRNFSEFLQAMGLPSTPQFVTVIMLGLLTIWAVKSPMASTGRWNIIFLVEVLFVFLITILAGIQQYDINNIKPIAENGISKLIQGGTTVFSFPFGDTVIFLLALGTLKANTNPYKMWYSALVLGGGVLFAASLRNILILGEQAYTNRYFSSYSAEMVITLGDFLSRFEVITGSNFLLCGFVKITMCLFAATKGIAKLFDIQDYKKIAAPTSLFMMIFSIILYGSMQEMFAWNTVSKYYMFPFQVIIPVLVWIIAEVKVKMHAYFKKPIPTS